MKYVTRNGGATVTIMVPYDCGNNCPFCVNKKEYEDRSTFSLSEILKSIEKMHSITPACDFVLTGGEPFANLISCQEILNAIPRTHKVFINTTLPLKGEGGIVRTEAEIADFINNNYNSGKITGVNVSRHLYPFVEECSDSIFDMIVAPLRINCVLYGKYSVERLQNYVKRFKKYTTYVQFRKDYTVTTPENLNDPNDPILITLKEAFEYIGTLGEYRMRNGYKFMDKDGFITTYHRTLPYSTIPLSDDKVVLYDIIIRQTGELVSDWNEYGKPLDLDAYKEVEFENYI